jgi:hypothetical protein
MGKLVFSATYENYDGDTTIKHINGFILGQHPYVDGDFVVSDLKEVTFTVSSDGLTASTTLIDEDYNYVPQVGDKIWVRLKDTNGTIEKCEVIEIEHDNWVYTNDDAASVVVPKFNKIILKNQDIEQYDRIEEGDTIALDGCTTLGNDIDYTVRSIVADSPAAGDTTIYTEEDFDTSEDLLVTTTIGKAGQQYTYTMPAGSSITAKENKITIVGQELDYIDVAGGQTITLANCTTVGNDGTYTVRNAVIDTDTTIYVTEDFDTDEAFDDGVSTITVNGDYVYIITDATSAMLSQDQELVIGEEMDALEHPIAGTVITLVGTANNNGDYTVATTTPAGGVTTITLDADWLLANEADISTTTMDYTQDLVYTVADATSSLTMQEDHILFKGVVYTDDIMKEFLVGDTVQLDNLDENSAFNGVDLEIETIATAGADTKITFAEDDNYTKWDFVDETMDDVITTPVTITSEDEAETIIKVNNINTIFGIADATADSFLITVPEAGTPECIVITNVDFNTPVVNIETIADDNP